jgi:hypothetical protein
MSKSYFEDELITGMQQQLYKQASNESPDLVKAGECLHAAVEIFEEAGLQDKANQVLQIMAKIAADYPTKKVHKMPSLAQLMEHGVTQRDLQEFGKGSPIAKAKINLALYDMGFSGHQISKFIGSHNVLAPSEARQIANPNRSIGKIWEWLQNPTKPDTSLPLTPGQDVAIQSLKTTGPKAPFSSQLEGKQVEDPSIPPELKFKSTAGKSDKHTNKLTSEKMIANLKNHGTVFNMADDGMDINDTNFDPEIAAILDGNDADDLYNTDLQNAEDLLDIDLVDDVLEVTDPQPLEDFEDEKDSGVKTAAKYGQQAKKKV